MLSMKHQSRSPETHGAAFLGKLVGYRAVVVGQHCKELAEKQ